LYDRNQRVTYTLNGYNKSNYNYQNVVYNNIGLLLQEFVAWKKVSAIGGFKNPFDNKNFLGFETFDNEFVSSNSPSNSSLNNINWNSGGYYSVLNTIDVRKKILWLDFPDRRDIFELTLANNGLDNKIYLYHIESGRSYTFVGDGYIQFMRSQKKPVLSPEQNRKIASKRIR